MIIQCAWCKKEMGEKAPLSDMSITHSICQKCSIEFLGVDVKAKKESILENPKKQTFIISYRIKGTKPFRGLKSGEMHIKEIKAISKADAKGKFIDLLGKDANKIQIIEVYKDITNNPVLKKVTILKDRSTGEYRVPGPAGTEAQAYYTDDKDDAVGTAKVMWKGYDFVIVFTSIHDFDRFLNNNPIHKKNPGANWHSDEKNKAIRKHNISLEQREQDFYQGKIQAHSDSISESKKLGINPKQSHYENIEYAAVELILQKHPQSDVVALLKQEFNIDNNMAKYYAKRADQIIHGTIKYISPKIARLLR